MSNKIKNLSIVTAHFADFDWTKLLIDNIIKYTEDSIIREIIVINQDRTLASAEILSKLHSKVRVIDYPRSGQHFRETGHDHAAVLNMVLSEVGGDYICIFDSDAHPTCSKWFEICSFVLEGFDAIVAECPGKPGHSHPCFMLFSVQYCKHNLSFDEGLFSEKIDTGRLIGRQLVQAGAKVYFAAATRCFGGMWGYLYLNSIYHHGNGSFSGGDDRLRSQLNWKHLFFGNFVKKHQRNELTFIEMIRYKLIHKYHNFQSICVTRK